MKRPLPPKWMRWQIRGNPNNVIGRSVFWLVLGSIGLCGCGVEDSATGESSRNFYDIEGLVREQLTMLDSIRPSVEKYAEINGDSERNVFIPDSATWREELDPLSGLDLNEPHLYDLYEVWEVQDSGIQYKSIRAKETRIDEVNIAFEGDMEKPAHVTARISSSNPLFSMSRNVAFEFAAMNGLHILKSYSITGWQKMVLLDTNHIRVSSEIMY